MPEPDSITAYRARVLSKHRAAFDFHSEVLRGIETATGVARTRPSLQRLVLDMLMLQCFKSLATVSLLAQHGLMEDAATIVRRILEISVTAVYIGADTEARVRNRRAGMYVTFMWRDLDRSVRRRLPVQARREWSRLAKRYARFVPAKARRWGPSFFDMFKALGVEDLYRADYSFLSSIAHGVPSNQVFVYTGTPIRAHDDRFASVLLIYATKYSLALTEQWNKRFRLIAPGDFRRWRDRAAAWRFRPSDPVAA